MGAVAVSSQVSRHLQTLSKMADCLFSTENLAEKDRALVQAQAAIDNLTASCAEIEQTLKTSLMSEQVQSLVLRGVVLRGVCQIGGLKERKLQIGFFSPIARIQPKLTFPPPNELLEADGRCTCPHQ